MKDFFTLDNSHITNLIENGFVKLKSMKNLNLDDFAHEIEKEIGNSTFSTSSKSHIKLLKKLELEKTLTPLLFKIAKEKYNYKGSYNNQYHVARMVRPGDLKEQYRAHFDSHIFTLVIPINIPLSKDKERGELIIYPNARRFPKTEMENIVGKIF